VSFFTKCTHLHKKMYKKNFSKKSDLSLECHYYHIAYFPFDEKNKQKKHSPICLNNGLKKILKQQRDSKKKLRNIYSSEQLIILNIIINY